MDEERYSRNNHDSHLDSSVDRPREHESRHQHRDGDSKHRYSSRRRDDGEDEKERTKVRRSRWDQSEIKESRDREKYGERDSRSKRNEREGEKVSKEGKKKYKFSDGKNGEKTSSYSDVLIQNAGTKSSSSERKSRTYTRESDEEALERAARLGYVDDPESVPFLNLFAGQSSTMIHEPANTPFPRTLVDQFGRVIDQHN